MSDRILTFEYRSNGALTDLEAPPVMSDPTEAFGVKEVAGGTVIVADGAPTTRVSTGVYQLALTGLRDVGHLAWFEWNTAGGVRRQSYAFTPTGGTTGQLASSLADLYREVSNYLGLGLAPAGEDLALAKKYANDGYRLFLMGVDPRSGRAYPWSFLAPAASLEIWPSVEADEAVTVTGAHWGGTTTLTGSGGALFRASMVGRTISITGVGAFPISGWISAGQIAVRGDATCSGKTFSIAADGAYGLPADFAAMVDDPVGGGPGAPLRLAPRSVAYVRQLHAAQPAAGTPRYYAVLPRAFTAAEGQRYDLLVWPVPGALLAVRYRYRLEPAALSADGDYPLGGPQHALTILEAALAVAEQRHNDTRGIHTEQFERLMAFSIDLDAAGQAHTLGDSGGGVEQGSERRGRVSYP